jgi:hypothetical protein
VCFLIFYTLFLRPRKKGGGINERGLIGTLIVQLATTLFKNPMAKGKNKYRLIQGYLVSIQNIYLNINVTKIMFKGKYFYKSGDIINFNV